VCRHSSNTFRGWPFKKTFAEINFVHYVFFLYYMFFLVFCILLHTDFFGGYYGSEDWLEWLERRDCSTGGISWNFPTTPLRFVSLPPADVAMVDYFWHLLTTCALMHYLSPSTILGPPKSK